MAIPTTNHDWATATVILPLTGQANKAEPSGSIQSAGMDYSQVLTCEEDNYWRASVHEWLDYIVDEKIPAVEAITLTAGLGLTGGGNLTANRTFDLGTPSTITSTSTNESALDTHTHAIDAATTAQAGIVQLNDTVASTSVTQAATANAVKQANDNAESRILATRLVDTGNGLVGGGDLTADRTLSVDFSTDAVSQALTSTTKVISPEQLAKAFKGSNQLLVGNGYQILPGGLIIQWATSAGGTYNWPITFPVACLSAVASLDSVVVSATNTHVGCSFTAGNYTITLGGDAGGNIHVIAVGY